jgi:cell division inhibitor SepF
MKIKYYWNNILDFFGFKEEHNFVDFNDNSKIVSLNQNQKRTKDLKLIFYHPDSYNEVKRIADDLKSKKAVILNLEKIENKQAHRFIDFLSGAIYALNGNVKKVGSEVFLFTPNNIEIDGEKLNQVIKDKYVN